MTIEEIVASWRACRACPLGETRNLVVVGEPWIRDAEKDGPLVLVVGEAPGAHEDRTGRPFVGPAGQILREDYLVPAGVALAYITNIVACRPPGNRDPAPGEIEACSPRLEALVAGLRPDALLLVGRIAERTIKEWALDPQLPRASVIHPAALLRRGHPTPETRKTVALQVAKVRRLLVAAGGTVTPRSIEPASASCAHVPVEIGVWRHESGRTLPLVACTVCATLLSEPPRRCA